MKKSTHISIISRKIAVLTALLCLGSQTIAQAIPISYSQGGFLLAQTFNPPGRGAPPKTADMGTRGCSVSPGQKPLTSLVPEQDLALTTQEYPTLFWYVPQAAGKTLRFTLMDEQDQTILYEKTIAAPSEGGIVSLKLSEDWQQRNLKSGQFVGLKANQLYHWYLSLACDPTDATGNVTLDGWIERTELSEDLQEKLAKTSPEDRGKIYAAAGIWHDALAAIAQLYTDSAHPAIAPQWETLLNSVKLGAFAQYPIIPASPAN